MYVYNSPPPPHNVNRNNCTLPLRASVPANVCGDLSVIHTRTEAANEAAYGTSGNNINCMEPLENALYTHVNHDVDSRQELAGNGKNSTSAYNTRGQS